MIMFVVDAAGEFGIREYLESWGRTAAKRVGIMLYEDLPKRTHVPAGTYVFAALDQLTPTQREMVARLRECIASESLQILNHPLRTLRRYQLLLAAHECGLNHFRAFRLLNGTHNYRYPVFVRMENQHTGSLTGLLDDPRALNSAILRLQVRGYNRDELLVIEFCDTRGDDGLFRKYSAFIVGKEIIPRAMSFSRDWMVKAGSGDWDRILAREELHYIERNPHEGILRKIFELSGVQYGRVDYGVLAGAPQVWEINLNPTIAPRLHQGPKNAEQKQLQELRHPAKKLFFSMFAEALHKIDHSSSAPALIPIRIDNRVARRIKRERYQTVLRQSYRTCVQKLSRNGAFTLLRPLLRTAHHRTLKNSEKD